MRSLVCAQCHVEYYFKGDCKYLTFPWDKGFTVEDMEAYYDEEMCIRDSSHGGNSRAAQETVDFSFNRSYDVSGQKTAHIHHHDIVTVSYTHLSVV